MTLDDILGHAEDRYFGSRYAQVANHISLDPPCMIDGQTTGTGRASIEIPPTTWSRKGDQQQRPHLSTIDVISIASQVADYAVPTGGYIKHMNISAPKKPLEDLETGIPISYIVDDPKEYQNIDIQIASFRVNACVTIGTPTTQGSGSDRVYKDVWRERVPRFKGLAINSEGATAEVTVPAVPVQTTGIEAKRGCGINIIDAFVATMQLGQVLLYSQDQMTRSKSNTLWMRQCRITSKAAPEPALVATCKTTLQAQRVATMNGHQWRLATIQGQVSDLYEINCSVAHDLGEQR